MGRANVASSVPPPVARPRDVSWATSVGTRNSMRSNRRADTRPELVLRSALHRLGLRFRKDYRLKAEDLILRPDVAFTRARVAVFVDGCFWHRCPVHGSEPKSNAGYWLPKLDANVARDRRADQALARIGWHVVRVWEHEPVGEAASRIHRLVLGRASD
ncbi:MAG TPA: very short patch repair endonuclease [Solirubrobacteraceae bacterium]|nr:very short patch repair endonuclease [Solirubrobacteraceae bacterium]